MDPGTALIPTGLQLKSIPGFEFLCAEARVNYEDVESVAADLFPGLQSFMASAQVKATGPKQLLFDYQGAGKQVLLRAGYPVAAAPDRLSGYSVSSLPTWKCACFTHHGPAGDISLTWHLLFEYVKSRAILPTRHSREIRFRDADFDSGEVIAELQLGIE